MIGIFGLHLSSVQAQSQRGKKSSWMRAVSRGGSDLSYRVVGQHAGEHGLSPEEEEAELVREEKLEALLSMLDARSEILFILAEEKQFAELFAELKNLQTLKELPKDNSEVNQMLLELHLELMDELEDIKKIETVAESALFFAPPESAERGELKRSLADRYREHSDSKKALEALRESAAIFDALRRKKG